MKKTELKKIISEVEEELEDTARADAKRRVKALKERIQASEKITANLERELEDLFDDLLVE